MKLKYRVIERFRGKYSVEAMCEVFEVSRSGYYAWRKRQGREAKDQWLVDLIAQCQQICKQTYGVRRVRRWIQRQTEKTVNVKAILRIMRKLSLLSVVRRRRPYTRYQQAVHKYPNLLNRCFDQAEAVYIMRKVVAECENPVMLYSVGKDSSVMLHIAMKAFYPNKPPFPFLHIDTTWKFREMIEFTLLTALTAMQQESCGLVNTSLTV